MRNLLVKILHEKAGYGLIFIFLVLLPLSIKFSNLSLIVLTLWSILWYCFTPQVNPFSKDAKTALGLVLAFYIINIIGVLYSTNLKEAFRHLEVLLPFVAFPVIFFLTKEVKWKVDRILLCFVASSLFLCLFIWLSIAYNMYINYEHINNYNFFIRSAFSFLSIHIMYAGAYMGTSVLILIDLKDKTVGSTFKLISLGFLILTLIFISSRGPSAYLVIVLAAFYFKRLFQNSKQLILLLISAFFGILLLSQNDFARDKIIDTLSSVNLINEKALTERGINYHKSNLRLQFWDSALTKIKENPVVGYGTGDAQLELEPEYIKRGLMDYLDFNSHNQYLQTLLEQGLLGITALLLPFIVILFKAKKENIVFLAITTYILFCFLTESYLLRQNGTMFVSFFLTLFLFDFTKKYVQQ